MESSRLTPDPRGKIFVEDRAYIDMDAWHATASELRRSAPVLRVEVKGYAPFWALTRHADVVEASRRSDLLWNTRRSVLAPDKKVEYMQARGVELPRTLVHMDGPEHAMHRRVTHDWFLPAAVKARQGALEALAEESVQTMLALGGRCDFSRQIAVPYTLRSIMSIFGIPESDEGLMLELTQGLFGATDPEYIGDFSDPIEAVMANVGRFDRYFRGLAADRRASPRDDLATVIARGRVEGCPLGDIETLWYFIIVATAGHDTAAYALSGGLEALLRHPDQMLALTADPSLIGNAVEEILRWTSPNRHFLRHAQRDTIVGGTPISAGDRLLLSYPSANRDEAVFPDAMRFDVTRPNARDMLAFGIGPHYCLGASFARLELKTFITAMLRRIEALELDGTPVWSRASFVGGVKHLPIRYRPR